MADAPRDNNRIPTLLGVDKTLFTIPTTIAVDPSTHELLVQSSGGAAGTQYTDGGVPPAHPIGNTIEWSDGANWQTVSTAKPLPVSGSFSLTNPTIGAAVPATANYIAASKAGTLTGLLMGSQTTANSLAVVLASDQVSIPVTASAGTNLNTSLLALESGGNLATIVTNTNKIPSLGQALAASSVPVVLTAAQLSTLTPLSTITVTQATGTNLHTVLDSGTITSITNALPAGANVIGHVIADTGSTTAVTGNVTVVQPTASNLNATVVGTGTFATQATLNAETTKVIGVVRTADGSGNLLTSTTNALDVNLKTSSITLPVSLASTVTVAGAKTNNNAAPGATNVGVLPAVANASTPAFTEGNQVALSTDLTGNVRTVLGNASNTSATATITPSGSLRVTQEASQIFGDTFDYGLDTINKWKVPTTGGNGIPATDVPLSGSTTLNGGTTLNSFSVLESQPSFPPTEPGWLFCNFRINIEFPVLTTAYRFWGIGTTPSQPTIANPVLEAAGFEISTTGKLFAVMYATGTRNLIADLSSSGTNKQPTDSNAHKYYLYFRGDVSYWAIDTIDNIVASTSTGAPGPNVNTLPAKILIISNSGTAATIVLNGMSIADTSVSSIAITDGISRWRQATVTAGGALTINTSQLNGIPISLGYGSTDNGTQRVVDSAVSPLIEMTMLRQFEANMSAVSGQYGYELR